MNTNNTNAIGIIGGADGPTAIFISGNPILLIIEIVLILILIFGGYIYFLRRGRVSRKYELTIIL